MDAAVVGAVAQSIIPYVLQLIKDHVALMTRNEKKIDKLSSNLRLLETSMKRYTDKHYYGSIQLMQLAKEIRELMNDVEDVLETYVVEEALHGEKNWVKRKADTGYRSRLHTIGERILNLNERVDKAYKDNQGIINTLLQIDEDRRRNPIPEANQLGSYPKADRIIGFEDAADDVLILLGAKSGAVEQSVPKAQQEIESKKLKVVTIHGMLGLGKTTLANKVFKAQETEYDFFTRIFIEVKEKYEKKEMLLSILRSLKSDIRDQNMDIIGLVKKVHEELKHKYLVVLDNVWNIAHWEDLKDAFPDKNNGSRVLITTRDVRVSHCIQPKTEAYPLRFMKKEEAEELLRMKVFRKNECPKHLESVEPLILRKCNGLPLAIVLTGGILLHHPKDLKHWNNVLDKVPLLDEENVIQIDDYIRLSYRNLHHKLKPCFLYLGVFPENLEIQVSKVLQLWIAEGFIPQHQTASLERIAEQYLQELVYRNLLIVGQRTLGGEIKTCRIHDTLREFCKKTAEAEDLFQAIDTNTNPSSSRRLCCINSHFSEFVRGGQPVEKVRSFLSFGEDETRYKEDSSSSIFKPFKLLRILDISSIHIKFSGRLPTKLSNLVLLKFIDINFNLKILPKSMSILHNLETLIVHTTEPTLDIQADIWGMTKLRHLHTNTTTSLPEYQDQSSSSGNRQTLPLQTLSAISPRSLRKEVFERTKKLKKLGICGSLGTLVEPDGDSHLFDYLCKLSTIENLKLHGADINSELQALPKSNKFPTNLKRLSLEKTSLKWNIHMPIIGKLQSLEVLKLKDNAFVGAEWKTEKGGFRSLKVLFIGDTDLDNWEVEGDDLPELRCLILKRIKSLEQMPSDFEHMKNLERIDLERTNRWLVKSAKDIQKSRPQIKLSVYPPEK
ncbi:putative late blight resistance protein homolog R1A-3 [Coffea arabica]|uniref:Late blight resistance protein homolog R1A-3 n=1 Tax=Coffea arabica TaxID=13443 RepID=A0A6P6UUH5_COFAR|nr:putative late blight resistance protein homolog R1A-10 [Coffea arabica]